MKPTLKTESWLLILLVLAACTATTKQTQPASIVQTPDTSTPNVAQKPTLIPESTQTPAPIVTVTFTPWPTKEVLAQFGIFGGDGGWEYFSFTGTDMPRWVLYTDGQFVVQRADSRGFWYEQTIFSVPQMCSFLSQVERAGFFSLAFDNSSASVAGIPTANPIYQFDDTTQFSEGGSQYVLQVNGSRARQIVIYGAYIPYLIPEAFQTFNLFVNYSPPSPLIRYQPQYLLLRIEKGSDQTNLAALPAWPADLPSLEMSATENVETAVSAFESHVSQVVVKNEPVDSIIEVFNDRFGYNFFQSEGRAYNVAARPFLPHETLDKFSGFPIEKEFALPFSCNSN
jgi:hypothetical protein